MSTKPTNPKDLVGVKKVGLSVLPARVLWRVALAMTEGMLKYGRHNYRAVGVRASVYFDATMRHVLSWWEGEDIDRDSALSHIDKAIASLVVLRDSMLGGNWTDDRPPRSVEDLGPLNEHVAKLAERYGHIQPRHYTIADSVQEAGVSTEREQAPEVNAPDLNKTRQREYEVARKAQLEELDKQIREERMRAVIQAETY